MPVEPRIEVEGLRGVQKAIRELGDKDMTKALRLANKSAAEVVAEAAREKTPVLTGRARASIRATAGQAYAAVRGGGPRALHFPWLDYGGRVGRNKSVVRPFKAGGRIIYPALAENRQQVTDKYADEIDAVIRAAGLD